ncbi:MAG: DUF192 domain-containing protein [Candidatus Aenigmarchaeota archaeon]|nr:DUF192 domain-containing protein [Candidatus Aenigmarchaeota archaeon]
MKIRNLTTGKIIAEDADLADTYWKRIKGLMFRQTGSMLFTFKKPGFYGIWMLFMRFPLYIIFLDSQMRVIDIAENARPVSLNPKTWRTYYPEKPAKYILEIPNNRKLDGIKIDDRVSMS